MENTNQPLI